MDDPAYPDALAAQYKLHWYVLERVLGQGGFGITYLARDSNLDKLVAIKEYLPVDTATRRADSTVSPRAQTQAERYSSGLDGFIREARTLARFNHPHIVRVHSVFQHNNTAYMVMEFEEGETLAALLDRRRTLPEGELLDIMLPVLDGLALVHAAGFIHRDIKPENILVRTDGSPVLLDFGSARAALGQSRTLTILVAPGYAPYEQYYANGESKGPWTDIYSLGATCYRAIAGVAPMDAIQRSKGVLGSTREMLSPASERGARRYSAPFLLAVDHALAFAERDRPQTLDAWRSELTGAGAAVSVAPVQATATVGLSPGAAAATQPARRSASRREMAGWAGVGAALTGIAFLLWPRSPAPEAERLAHIERQLRAVTAAAASAQVPAPAAAPVAAAPSLPPVAPSLPETSGSPKADSASTKASNRSRPDSQAAPLPKTAPVASALPRPSTVALARAPAPEPASVPAPAPLVAQPSPAPPPAPSPAAATLTAASTAPAPVAAAATVTAAAAPREEPKSVATAKALEAVAPSDDKEAFAFQRARALKGDQEARFQLGEMYAQGKGVVQSPNQAYLWYGLAARSGHSAARARQAQVGERLQPAERRQADRQIEQIGKTAE